MSSQNAWNPYSASDVGFSRPTWADEKGLEYTQSFKFVFENANWVANVLLICVCNLIGGIVPILPGLVLIGYQCEVLEGMLVRPNQTYPDFKVERTVDYLVRGVWPFVIGLLASIVMIPLILLAVALPIATMVVFANMAGRDAEVVVWIMAPIIAVVGILAATICNIALVPFLLRAALTQDISAAIDFQFAKEFVRRMWKETLFAGLFLVALALAAQAIGLLLFCVGVLVTVPIVQLAQVHLAMQLYRLYLARGGEKIPLKSTIPAAV
jgi:hypothetical protein